MQASNLLEKIEFLNNNPKGRIEELSAKINLQISIESEEQAHDVFLLGRGYMLTSKYDVSAQLLHKALTYFISNGDKMSLFQCYANLGVVYREERQFDLALKSFYKSYNLSYDLDDFSFVIQALVNLASVYSYMENIHKSLELLEKALEYKDEIKNNKILGDLYNNYAYVLLGERKYQEGLHYFLQAYEAYKSVYGDIIQTSILIAISNIGETYVHLGDYEKAFEHINKALKYAEENQIRFIEIDCHLNLSKMYEAQNDFQKALIHHKMYSELNDMILAEQSKDEIDLLKQQMEKESKKSEEEINILRNVELKNKTLELEKTLKNLSHISQIGRNLTSSMDLDQIYEILRKSIYGLMTVDVFGLALYNQEDHKIIYKYFEEGGFSLPLIEIDVEDRQSLASYCIVHEEDIFIRSFDEEYQKYLPKLTYVAIGENKKNTTRCIVYCRLISEEKCIGLITMQSYHINEYTDSDFQVIKALASYVAIAISNAQKKNIISEKASALEYLSYNDPLTELYNRRYFNQISYQIDSEPYSEPVGLIIGDMNRLKEINDCYGHQMGDLYLSEIAKILKEEAKGHLVFRLSGDEFAILAYHVSDQLMEDLISRIQFASMRRVIGPRTLSISLGYEIKTNKTQFMDEIFTLAESKMYESKKKYNENNK